VFWAEVPAIPAHFIVGINQSSASSRIVIIVFVRIACVLEIVGDKKKKKTYTKTTD